MLDSTKSNGRNNHCRFCDIYNIYKVIHSMTKTFPWMSMVLLTKLVMSTPTICGYCWKCL